MFLAILNVNVDTYQRKLISNEECPVSSHLNLPALLSSEGFQSVILTNAIVEICISLLAWPGNHATK